MNIFVIYKQILSSNGNVEKIELVECDTNEAMAQRFARLYSLQTPADLKHKISFHHVGVRVI